MNGSQILESLLLCEYEDNSIVSISSTWMNWNRGWFVDNHKLLRHADDLDLLLRYWDFMSKIKFS